VLPRKSLKRIRIGQFESGLVGSPDHWIATEPVILPSKLSRTPTSGSQLADPKIRVFGGTRTALVTRWLHVLVFLKASTAIQVAVATDGKSPLVTTSTSVTVTLVPPHASSAVGAS